MWTDAEKTRVGGRRPTVGFCYLIEDFNRRLVKIGWSRDPKRRLKNLIAASDHRMRLVGIQLGGRLREAILHRRFAAQRVRREWFAPCPSMYAAFGLDYRPFAG